MRSTGLIGAIRANLAILNFTPSFHVRPISEEFAPVLKKNRKNVCKARAFPL